MKNVGEINFKNVKNVNFFISMLHTYLSFSDMAFNDNNQNLRKFTALPKRGAATAAMSAVETRDIKRHKN